MQSGCYIPCKSKAAALEKEAALVKDSEELDKSSIFRHQGNRIPGFQK
jgi:hypothetical protein